MEVKDILMNLLIMEGFDKGMYKKSFKSLVCSNENVEYFTTICRNGEPLAIFIERLGIVPISELISQRSILYM